MQLQAWERGEDITIPKTTLVPYARSSSAPHNLAEAGMERAPQSLFSTIFPGPPRSLTYQAYATRKNLPRGLSSHVFQHPVALHIMGFGKTGRIASKSLLSCIPGAPLHFPSLPRAGIEGSPPRKSLLRRLWPVFTFLASYGISFLGKGHKSHSHRKKMTIRQKINSTKEAGGG